MEDRAAGPPPSVPTPPFSQAGGRADAPDMLLVDSMRKAFAFRACLDPFLDFLWVSRGVEEVTGFPAAAFLSCEVRYENILTPGEAAVIRASIAEAHSRDGAFENEHLIRAQDGSFRWVFSRGRVVKDEAGNPRYVEGFNFDVTERREIEDALRAREAEVFAAKGRFRLLIENVGAAIVEWDHRGTISYMNPLALRELAAPEGEVEGRTLAEVLPPTLAEHLSIRAPEVIETRGSARDEIRIELRGDQRVLEAQTYYQTDTTGELPTLLTIVHDVTEKRKVEAQLLLADRMVSMGTMAAGVAHEINNPLTYIIGNIAYIKQEIEAFRDLHADDSGGITESVLAFLEEIEPVLDDAATGAERVAAIVRDLKLFSRKEQKPPGPTDVASVINSVVRMMRNEIEHRATLELAFERVPSVLASDARLAQVCTALLVNAIQALPEQGATQNRIQIRVENEPGGVLIVVRDNGPGIAKEVLPRIFDPFFTTKPPGVGTGLGLSICHGIVTALGGSMDVQSEPGRGAEFRVHLKVAEERDKPVHSSRSRTTERPVVRRRVFVAEDDEGVQRTIERLVGDRYELVIETDAAKLLDRVRSGEPVDAIVCDLMMPGVSGVDVFEEIERVAPELLPRCGFISAGIFTERVKRFRERLPDDRLLDKPFSAAELAAFVERLLVHAPSRSMPPEERALSRSRPPPSR